MKVVPKLLGLIFIMAVVCIACARVQAQSDDEGYGEHDSTAAAEAAKRLINRDPLVRQQGAEELARLSATDWRKLVEGYRQQERDSRVKLALDWALSRMGKTETLYTIVRALDSSRSVQAKSYLEKLDSPEPLYVFLEESGNDKVKARLLEVLARIGDAGTLERIKPHTASLNPKTASAAQVSMREINARLAQAPPDAPTRPRRVGNADETSP